MGISLFQVDAFTDQPFRGNPAAVCILPELRTDAWMQDVAREMNLPETAFVLKQNDYFHLRWFTPTMEVDLCGHATLATAHTLWEAGLLAPEEIARFHTRSGLLTAALRNEEIELDFPATPDHPTNAPEGLEEALGATALYVGKSDFDYLVQLASEESVRSLRPSFAQLKDIPTRGIIVTSAGDASEYDFVSRFFAPRAGIDEDPVTGSAHCCLGPFWSRQQGKTEFLAYQASERGGIVRVRLHDERVLLLGRGVTVLRGELVDA